ncbi:MAG: hypothetical protein LUG83_11515 [Lachnospiraceae bacterium]|nr:hypothetical protein [Lachnospiraceae bacterium]
MRIKYKGVVCNTGYERVMGKEVPALYYVESPDQDTLIKAGFEEIHYGRWVKLLNDTEFKEVLDLI